MSRKRFDALLSATGLVLDILLLAAGGLLTWGNQFLGNQVHDQLAAQKIFIPPVGSPALASPEIKPYLSQYAGQQLTTGAQAQAYADHFIGVHLKEISGGKTYAELSKAAQAEPANTKLAATVNTVFKGETLRGLLLNAYAFGTMARIAAIAAIAAFTGAVVLLLLSALGLAHLRRTSTDTDIVVPRWHPEAHAV